MIKYITIHNVDKLYNSNIYINNRKYDISNVLKEHLECGMKVHLEHTVFNIFGIKIEKIKPILFCYDDGFQY